MNSGPGWGHNKKSTLVCRSVIRVICFFVNTKWLGLTLDKHEIFSVTQFCFKKSLSTMHQISEIIESIKWFWREFKFVWIFSKQSLWKSKAYHLFWKLVSDSWQLSIWNFEKQNACWQNNVFIFPVSITVGRPTHGTTCYYNPLKSPWT